MQKLRTDLGQVTDGARGEERLMREVRVTLPSAVLATRLNNKYRYERQVLPLLGNERGQTWSSARRPMRARFADATVNVAHDSSIVSVFEGSPPAWLIVVAAYSVTIEAEGCCTATVRARPRSTLTDEPLTWRTRMTSLPMRM